MNMWTGNSALKLVWLVQTVNSRLKTAFLFIPTKATFSFCWCLLFIFTFKWFCITVLYYSLLKCIQIFFFQESLQSQEPFAYVGLIDFLTLELGLKFKFHFVSFGVVN